MSQVPPFVSKLTLLATLLLAGGGQAAEKASIRFDITGVEADRGGRILCALYRSERSWLGDRPYRSTLTFVNGKSATCVFWGMPAGKYAIAALHDEDGDSEMDTILGLPQEGYCTSRDAEDRTILAPRWKHAVFDFDGERSVQTADVNY